MHINPVFIYGCQRSGTTMLASQLGGGSQCTAFPEMQFVLWLVSQQYRNTRIAEAAYAELMDDFRFKASGLEVDRKKFIEDYDSSDLAKLVFNIIEQNLPQHKQAETIYWFEHNPENRGYVELLLKVFPDAKFIHIVRDPRAVYFSMRDNPRWRIADPLKLSRVWCDAVAKGFLYASKYPDRVITVCYEDYVRNARQELTRICDFMGLNFEQRMLQGSGVQLPQFTQHQHAKTRGPADASHSEKWREGLSEREIAVIDHQCYDWMCHYGYVTGERNRIRIRYYEKLLYMMRSTFSQLRSKVTVQYQNRVH